MFGREQTFGRFSSSDECEERRACEGNEQRMHGPRHDVTPECVSAFIWASPSANIP